MEPLLWPLPGCERLFPDAPGRFGAERTHETHTGVDLYCQVGQRVVAMEDGVVVNVELFTGEHVPGKPSPWWNNTWAVLIEGASGVIAYGEIQPHVHPGERVIAGQMVGTVVPVLRKFKGRPMVMLHVERLRRGTKATALWPLRESKPRCLLDPTPLLARAAGTLARTFDMDLYEGVRFRDPSAPSEIKYAFGSRLQRP